MKKILFLATLLAGFMITSCENDEINIDVKRTIQYGTLTASIDPADLYSSYNYVDTWHSIKQISEAYRTFNSDNGYYIEMRTLIYDKATDELVDSILQYLPNINPVTITRTLPVGEYYVVSTLSFASDKDGKGESIWRLHEREKLASAKLVPSSRRSMWCILSVANDEATVTGEQEAHLTITPKPVGTLVYNRLENFQYVDEASYGIIADNKVRELAVYTRRSADSYNLDPRASSKVNYLDEASSTQWYYASTKYVPTLFDKNWTHFGSNLYAYFYILEPQANIKFGYTLEGETGFHGYGEQSITIEEPGMTYLAYWDWFKVGNPYFGKADNNHYNSYSAVSYPFELPYYSWGVTKPQIKDELNKRNYIIETEGSNSIRYKGKYRELGTLYTFDNLTGSLWTVDVLFDPTKISNSELKEYIDKNISGFSYLGDVDGSGTLNYMSYDRKTILSIGLGVLNKEEVRFVEFYDVDYVTNGGNSRFFTDNTIFQSRTKYFVR